MNNIIIIAGGPSVADYPANTLTDYGHVIGVNEASVIFPCHEAVSMDRLWMEARYEALQWKEIPVWFRRCAWKLGIEWPHLNLFDGDVHVDRLSDKRNELHGKNSGMCAINLAYHKRPERVFLFGFDMKTDKHGEHYFHKGYEWKKQAQSGSKYKYWLPMFKNVAAQMESAGIKVYNVSPGSAVPDFEKIGWEEFECLAR